MLTIIGSGINNYLLNEVAAKIDLKDFDCIITDKNFDKEENILQIPLTIKKYFLPYKEIKPLIKENLLKNKNILYVVTGSPMFFSATADLISYLTKELDSFNPADINIISAESSKDYLLRKLHIPENEVTALSLHGRNSLDLSRFLQTKYTFLLCDKNSIEIIKNNIKYLQEDITCYIGSKLGSEKETIEKLDLSIQNFSPEEIEEKYSPYVLCLEKNYENSYGFSKTEDFCTNAGMITKTDKRGFSLEALELKPNLLMWDIGAGSGSVSIDAYKIFKTQSILFEKNESQFNFIEENLKKHKIAGARVIKGDFLENSDDIPSPDRIFIGGGGEKVLKTLPELYKLLKYDGVLVANVIVLENFTEAIQTLKKSNIKYEVRSLDISYFKKMSEKLNLNIPEPERTLYQIILRK